MNSESFRPKSRQEVLEAEVSANDTKKKTPCRRQQVTPVQLEVQQVVLEPGDRNCTHCHQKRPRIGKEVSTEYDY
jgi:hypothetical protein